jgi:hypothetical protein
MASCPKGAPTQLRPGSGAARERVVVSRSLASAGAEPRGFSHSCTSLQCEEHEKEIARHNESLGPVDQQYRRFKKDAAVVRR